MLHFSVLCFCPFGWLVFLISGENQPEVFRGKRAHGTGTLQGHLPPVWGVDRVAGGGGGGCGKFPPALGQQTSQQGLELPYTPPRLFPGAEGWALSLLSSLNPSSTEWLI